jgi:peptidylprolyl isomerase
VRGTGRAAKRGDVVVVRYVAAVWSSGSTFDATWDRGVPFKLKLGAGSVIPGFDRGIRGMRVGGRREVVIPPRLAYGATGHPPAIGPGETLVYVIDLARFQEA